MKYLIRFLIFTIVCLILIIVSHHMDENEFGAYMFLISTGIFVGVAGYSVGMNFGNKS